MNAITAVATAVLLGFAASAATAQSATGAPAKPVKVASAKKSTKTSAAQQHLKEQAQPEDDAPQTLSANQLGIASNVHTGKADCEFSQTVQVEPHPTQAGYFKVAHKGATYLMTPEETTTGAVRLHDKKAGVMWLQIANKSMLMNSKIGQRMVDSCVHAAQRGGATRTAALLQ